MGVQDLWSLLEPVGRRINIEAVANKKLAIDASIWLFQFMKAMRDDRGDVMKNAHLLGFFRRICRLLFHKVKPVFVFDGATPALKRSTNIARRRKREMQGAVLRKTAEKLLINRLKQQAVRDLQKQRDEGELDKDSDADADPSLPRAKRRRPAPPQARAGRRGGRGRGGASGAGRGPTGHMTDPEAVTNSAGGGAAIITNGPGLAGPDAAAGRSGPGADTSNTAPAPADSAAGAVAASASDWLSGTAGMGHIGAASTAALTGSAGSGSGSRFTHESSALLAPSTPSTSGRRDTGPAVIAQVADPKGKGKAPMVFAAPPPPRSSGRFPGQTSKSAEEGPSTAADALLAAQLAAESDEALAAALAVEDDVALAAAVTAQDDHTHEAAAAMEVEGAAARPGPSTSHRDAGPASAGSRRPLRAAATTASAAAAAALQSSDEDDHHDRAAPSNGRSGAAGSAGSARTGRRNGGGGGDGGRGDKDCPTSSNARGKKGASDDEEWLIPSRGGGEQAGGSDSSSDDSSLEGDLDPLGLLPGADGELDPEVMASLPQSVQLEILERMRDAQQPTARSSRPAREFRPASRRCSCRRI